MSENMKDSKTTTPDHRHFDWGPPANNGTDSVKEWLVYFAVLLLLGAGVWILLDINGKDTHSPTATATSAISGKTKPLDSAATEQTSQVPAQVAAASKFFVQLGAFANETSAQEVYDQMVKEGFAPTLATPDHQYEIYRIFVGPFASEAEAELKAQQLNELEFNCFVSEIP